MNGPQMYVVVNPETGRIYAGPLPACAQRAALGWKWAGTVAIAASYLREWRARDLGASSVQLAISDGWQAGVFAGPPVSALRLHLAGDGEGR